MPRKKLARRFEPRFGVSLPMLEVESGYVAQELQDYLLLSLDELRKKLHDRGAALRAIEPDLRGRLSSLSERENLALQCMLGRDFFHLASLYVTLLAKSGDPDRFGEPTGVPRTSTPAENSPAIPFAEWLFGQP